MKSALAIATVIVLMFSPILVPLVNSQGNADVTRTRNLQYFELESNDIDVSRNRNLQFSHLEPKNVYVTRYRNLQFSQLEPKNVDLTRYRNLQYFRLKPTDVDVTRFRNLQFFKLAEVGDFAINITSLITTDQSGNPKTSFNRGDVVQFNFTVENLGSLTLSMGLISTEILDPLNTPVFLGYLFADLPSGLNRQFVTGYRISTDASSGTYTVKIMVFTDWPSQGGIGLDIQTETFVVT